MATDQRAVAWSIVEQQYDAILRDHPDDWYAVLESEIVHATDRRTVVAELRRRGIGEGAVLIARAPGRQPHLIL